MAWLASGLAPGWRSRVGAAVGVCVVATIALVLGRHVPIVEVQYQLRGYAVDNHQTAVLPMAIVAGALACLVAAQGCELVARSRRHRHA